jgi:hypothetical protein
MVAALRLAEPHDQMAAKGPKLSTSSAYDVTKENMSSGNPAGGGALGRLGHVPVRAQPHSTIVAAARSCFRACFAQLVRFVEK